MRSILESVTRIEAMMVMQVSASKLVKSVSEAAAYLDLSEAMLYKLTSERLIPHFKPSGKKIYFSKEDLDRWALSNRVRTSEEIGEETMEKKGGKKK